MHNYLLLGSPESTIGSQFLKQSRGGRVEAQLQQFRTRFARGSACSWGRLIVFHKIHLHVT